MKKKENKSIQNFTREQKKVLKVKLNAIKESCKKQNEYYYNLYLKPNENTIKAIDRFLLNPPCNLSKRKEQIGIKQLIYIINKAQKYKEKVKNEN